MSKASYAKYLESNHWKQLRRKKRGLSKKRCAICASTDNLQTHHLFYRNLHDVQTSDLRILCGRCHQVAHELIKAGEIGHYTEHNGMFLATKEKVKKRLGLTGKNLFYPRV